MIGERTAEEIKIKIGSAYAVEEELVRGQGPRLVAGLPKTLIISPRKFAKRWPNRSRSSSSRSGHARALPAGTVRGPRRPGIVLAGGGALLRGLGARLESETAMPVVVARDPLSCVAIGSGQCLEEFDVLKRVLITSSSR